MATSVKAIAAQPVSLSRIVRLPPINYMPANGVEFRPANGVTIPAEGATAIVVQFQIPKGYNGVINYLANVFIGAGFTDFSGALYWSLYRDYTTKVFAPNFQMIIASLGSVNNPAKLNGIRVKENQLVTLTVTNTASPGGITPAGQTIAGLIGGYYYPVDKEPEGMSF